MLCTGKVSHSMMNYEVAFVKCVLSIDYVQNVNFKSWVKSRSITKEGWILHYHWQVSWPTLWQNLATLSLITSQTSRAQVMTFIKKIYPLKTFLFQSKPTYYLNCQLMTYLFGSMKIMLSERGRRNSIPNLVQHSKRGISLGRSCGYWFSFTGMA